MPLNGKNSTNSYRAHWGLPLLGIQSELSASRTTIAAISYKIPPEGNKPCCGKVDVTLQPKFNGVGSILSRLFSKMGYKAVEDTEDAKKIAEGVTLESCGSCVELLIKMDNEGPDWCERNIIEIVRKIGLNASRHKVPIFGTLDRIPLFKTVVTRFVTYAITEARSFQTMEEVVKTGPKLSKLPPYTPVEEKPFPLKSSRAIVTIAIGDHFQEVLRLARRSLQRYADKCNADFIVLEDKTQGWPLYEKFRIKSVAESYDRTLFIDADCLIRKSCPDLFDLVPRGHVGMHNDTPHNLNCDWLRRTWSDIMHSQGIIQQIKQPVQTLNSGVVLCDKEHAYIWTPPEYPLPGKHEDEQVWVQSTIERTNTPVFTFPRIFNEQWYFRDFKANTKNAQIIHFANCKTRLQTMAQYMKEIYDE